MCLCQNIFNWILKMWKVYLKAIKLQTFISKSNRQAISKMLLKRQLFNFCNYLIQVKLIKNFHSWLFEVILKALYFPFSERSWVFLILPFIFSYCLLTSIFLTLVHSLVNLYLIWFAILMLQLHLLSTKAILGESSISFKLKYDFKYHFQTFKWCPRILSVVHMQMYYQKMMQKKLAIKNYYHFYPQ